MIREFTMNWTAESSQLNLAHIAKNKKIYIQKDATKTNANVHLVKYRFIIREGSTEGTRKTVQERICVKEMSFKSGVNVMTVMR